MNNLPASTKHNIFMFISYPTADAVRDSIMHFQAFSNEQAREQLNLYKLCVYVVTKKIEKTMDLIKAEDDRLGAA